MKLYQLLQSCVFVYIFKTIKFIFKKSQLKNAIFLK